jgi:hypothetical protein
MQHTNLLEKLHCYFQHNLEIYKSIWLYENISINISNFPAKVLLSPIGRGRGRRGRAMLRGWGLPRGRSLWRWVGPNAAFLHVTGDLVGDFSQNFFCEIRLTDFSGWTIPTTHKIPEWHELEAMWIKAYVIRQWRCIKCISMKVYIKEGAHQCIFRLYCVDRCES